MAFQVVIITDMFSGFGNGVRPIGGYVITSVLRSLGYSVIIIPFANYLVRDNYMMTLLDAFVGDETLFIGFGGLFMNGGSVHESKIWSYPEEDAQKILEFAKERNIPTVYGGVSADRVVIDDKLKHLIGVVDYVTVGQGDRMIVDIINYIEGKSKYINYNIAYGSKTKVLDYDMEGNLHDYRNAFIQYRHYDFFMPEESLIIELSRGCMYKCKFCSYPSIGKDQNDVSYIKSKEVVKAMLIEAYEMFGITHFAIVDDTFNESIGKLQVIRDVVVESGIPFTFECQGRLELMAKYPEMIDLIREIGVITMSYGIETLNWDSGKAIGKEAKPEKVKQTLENIKDNYRNHGKQISLASNFIVGLPYDTPETILEWMDWVYHTDLLDGMSIYTLLMNGSSEFVKEPEKYGYTVFEDYKWTNDIWSYDEADKFREKLLKLYPKPHGRAVRKTTIDSKHSNRIKKWSTPYEFYKEHILDFALEYKYD